MFQKRLLDSDLNLEKFYYSVEKETIQASESSIMMYLFQQTPSIYYANQLTANITFY